MQPGWRHLVAVLGTLALACGGQTSSNGGGTAGRGSGGTAGSGGTMGAGGSKGGGGGTRGSGGGGSKGTGSVDASDELTLPPLDAALASLDAAPPGRAGFAFIVNDVVQHPMVCPSDNWEFPLPPGEGPAMPTPPIKGVKNAYIVNTGALPLAYLAQSSWALGTQYVPGVSTGGSSQLVGVLAPGANVDITSAYAGDHVALLGSAEPFSSPDAGMFTGDEGTIPWPAGVSGSGGATTMNIAEIEVAISDPSACFAPYHGW